jgi:hypothetical protein
MKALRAFGEYIKTSEESGEVDEKKMDELRNKFEESGKNYDAQIKLYKEKFDIKLNEVTKDEENKRIKNYITLKKIEMQQELLNRELNLIHEDIGLSDEQISNNPELQGVIKKAQEAAKKNAQMEKEQREILKQKGEVSLGFDMDEAKRDPEKYLWEDSPFSKGDFELEKGDKIVYFSVSNSKSDDKYKGTDATVITVLDDKEGSLKQVEVRTNDEDLQGFRIPMGKIMKVERYDDKQKSKKPEDGAEEDNTGEVKVETEIKDTTTQNEEEVSSDGPVKSTSPPTETNNRSGSF